MVEVKNLAISFPGFSGPVKPVSDVSFDIPPKTMLALVGESGSGKSLTAFAIMGLVPSPGELTSGKICLNGMDITALTQSEMRSIRGAAMGMVFQEPTTSLNPVYTVGFHLREALGGGLGAAEARAKSASLLAEVGIPEPEARLKGYPHELSGGMRQRVMIACAMARNPSLLIADEPTTALDVTVEAQIMSLISRLKEARGAAVLLVTHDLGLVAQHADEVAVMYAGYIVERAKVAELFRKPLHPYTRALMEALPSGARGARLKPIPGNVPEPSAMGPGCPFAERCEIALTRCFEALPDLDDCGGRLVRCVRAAEYA